MKSKNRDAQGILRFVKHGVGVWIIHRLAAGPFCFAQNRNAHYLTNQDPLIAQPYTPLPLGSIQAEGLLKRMLELQRDGLTGNLDRAYAVVCGDRNGWLGGTGDGWGRGSYWIDHLNIGFVTPRVY